MPSANKTGEEMRTDPVVPDQGGRSMPSDPADPIHLGAEEAIRRRAYELYEQRGRKDGHAAEDWLAAEGHIKRSPA